MFNCFWQISLMWNSGEKSFSWTKVYVKSGFELLLFDCLFLFLNLKRVQCEPLGYEGFLVNFADFQIQNIRFNRELLVVPLKKLFWDRARRVESYKWVDNYCCCVKHPFLVNPSLLIEYQFLLILSSLPPLRLMTISGESFCQLHRNEYVKTRTKHLTSWIFWFLERNLSLRVEV